MKYIYDSHTGGIFFSDTILDYEELYCETCNDCDHLIGSFETLQDLWELLEPECDIDGCGGWSLQYLFPIIVREFNLPVEVTYANYNEQSQGFCNLTDKQIVEYIKQYENTTSN